MYELLLLVAIIIAMFLMVELVVYYRRFHRNSQKRFWPLLFGFPLFVISYNLAFFVSGNFSIILHGISLLALFAFVSGAFALWRYFR